MSRPVALLVTSRSRVPAELGRYLERLDVPFRALHMDAPLAGAPVTVGPDRLDWEGFNILDAGVLFVERPEFPWPQPLRLDALPAERDAQAAVIAAEREARSLIVSAICAAAERIPVVNRPEACHLAASPAMALDRLGRAGLPVHPWRLAARPDSSGGGTTADAVGGDRWHAASPFGDDPALLIDPAPGPVILVATAGDRAPVMLEHDDAGAWAPDALHAPPDRDPAPPRPLDRATPGIPALALDAARILGLDVAVTCIALNGGEPRILYVDAAPDIAYLDFVGERRYLPALAAHLAHLAAP